MNELTKKAIKGLECCLNTGGFEKCKENCPYFSKEFGISVCSENMLRDALTLLKAQEPMKPKVNHFEFHNALYDGCVTRAYCPKCEIQLIQQVNYCPRCGQAVKWNE